VFVFVVVAVVKMTRNSTIFDNTLDAKRLARICDVTNMPSSTIRTSFHNIHHIANRNERAIRRRLFRHHGASRQEFNRRSGILCHVLFFFCFLVTFQIDSRNTITHCLLGPPLRRVVVACVPSTAASTGPGCLAGRILIKPADRVVVPMNDRTESRTSSGHPGNIVG
jgi:hypothetical protein